MITDNLSNYIKKSAKGKPNGVCPLNSSGLVPLANIDPNFLEYKGVWDALINSPVLSNGMSTVNTGNVLIVSVAGTQMGMDFEVGDFVLYDGTNWKKVGGVAAGISTITNTDGKITIDNTNPNIPIMNLLNFYRWGNGAHRGLIYEHRSPSLNGSQIAFNATLITSISTCNIGWLSVNRGYDSDMISSLKSLWSIIKDNLPMKIRMVDTTNEDSYFTLSLTSFLGTGGFSYSYNCVNVPAETTATNVLANGSRYYLLFDYSNRSYIDSQTSSKVDTLTNTDTLISITGTGPSRSLNLANTIPVTRGGTGINTYAVGDVLTANTTSSLSRLAGVATGNALISGGVGVVPSWGKVGLTTHVSGALPVANGGTNVTTYAIGDILQATATTTLSRLAGVATGNALISGGVGVANSWGKVGLTTHVSGILPLANGGTNGATISDARINLRWSRNLSRTVMMRLCKFASTYAINPNFLETEIGLGYTGAPGTFDNLTVLQLQYPVNMMANFYPEINGTTFQQKWIWGVRVNANIDLANVVIGMCSDEYLKNPQQVITTANSCLDGFSGDNIGVKFGARFSGNTALRQFVDGTAGTSLGTTRIGSLTSVTGAGTTNILLMSLESQTAIALHWYTVSGTTMTFVSRVNITMPWTNAYQDNRPNKMYHPCVTHNGVTLTAISQRYLEQFTTVTGGIYTHAGYYHLIY